MKLAGKTIEGLNEVTVVLPRGNADDLVFKFVAVVDNEKFDKLVPEVKPEILLKPGGKKDADITSPAYIAAVSRRDSLRTTWLFLESIKATPDLEWETVKDDDSSTWDGYTEELKKAGIGNIEVMRLMKGFMEANCLSEELIDNARQSFLAGQVEA